MKTLCISLLILSQWAILSAQVFNLPISTSNEPARNAYEAATYLAANLRMTAAQQEIDKALELDPNFFMAYMFSWQFLAPECTSSNLLEKALAIDPTHFTEAEQIMRHQARIWLKAPHASPAKAMAALVEAYPNIPEAYEWAELHAASTDHNLEQAMTYAQQLVALEQYHPPVYHRLGYYYMELNEIKQAEEAFTRYLELAPTEPHAHHSMAKFYRSTAQYGLAAEHYHGAAALGMTSDNRQNCTHRQ